MLHCAFLKHAGLRTPVLMLVVESTMSGHRRAESRLIKEGDGDRNTTAVNATVTTVLSIPAAFGGLNVNETQNTETFSHSTGEDGEENRRQMQISYNGAEVFAPC